MSPRSAARGLELSRRPNAGWPATPFPYGTVGLGLRSERSAPTSATNPPAAATNGARPTKSRTATRKGARVADCSQSFSAKNPNVGTKVLTHEVRAVEESGERRSPPHSKCYREPADRLAVSAQLGRSRAKPTAKSPAMSKNALKDMKAIVIKPNSRKYGTAHGAEDAMALVFSG